MRNKTKFTLVFVALAVIAVMIISAFTKIDNLQASRKLTNNDYSVGAVSVESGKVIESKQSYYTENLMELEGAEFKVEDDATASYKVFFYDEDEKYISATSNLTGDLDIESIPETAKYFRVMVTPALVDGEPVECTVFNTTKYISQISITIAK